MIRAGDNSKRYFYWYTFLMVFPTIIILFNVSIYVFVFVWNSFRRKYGSNFSLKPIESKIALLFLLGTTISLFDVWTLEQGWARVETGLRVWPNYIYWTILIIFLVRHFGHLDFGVIAKACFWGMVFTLIYFFVPVLSGLQDFDMFKGLQQNTLSFIMLIYVPLALVFVHNHYGLPAFIIVGFVSVILAFESGSRSGSILVTGGFLVMCVFFLRRNIVFALPVIAIGSLFLFGSTRDSLQGLIEELNPRTHDLIYNGSQVLTSDFSYLTRVAIQQKGMSIYKANPVTGVGINNFSKYSTNIKYDFSGGELIRHDDEFIQKASAHNSYLSILCETGLVGFIPFILLLLVCFSKLANRMIRYKLDMVGVALMSGFVSMLIHMWFISAILNVFAWFFIGLVCVYNYQKRIISS